MENSEACTCNDLEDMQAVRDEADALYNGFVSVLGSFDGPSPPRNWEEASNRASDIAFGQPEGGESGSGSTPVAGLDENLEPWIDPDFASSHCLAVSQSYIEHELEHRKSVQEREADRVANWINSVHGWIDPAWHARWHAREMTKMDVNAYHAQRQYLDRQLGEMTAACRDKKEWECSCTGETYDSEAACWGSCHVTLGCFNWVCKSTQLSGG